MLKPNVPGNVADALLMAGVQVGVHEDDGEAADAAVVHVLEFTAQRLFVNGCFLLWSLGP